MPLAVVLNLSRDFSKSKSQKSTGKSVCKCVLKLLWTITQTDHAELIHLHLMPYASFST